MSNITKKNALRIGWVIAAVLTAAFVGLAVAWVSTINPSNNAGGKIVEDPRNVPNVGAESPMEVSLDGKWSETNNGSQFVATIANNTINIEFVHDDTSVTYWNGTFESSKLPGETVVSTKVDVDKMVLSGAESKDFLIDATSISFEFRGMGMTDMVRLTRA